MADPAQDEEIPLPPLFTLLNEIKGMKPADVFDAGEQLIRVHDIPFVRADVRLSQALAAQKIGERKQALALFRLSQAAIADARTDEDHPGFSKAIEVLQQDLIRLEKEIFVESLHDGGRK